MANHFLVRLPCYATRVDAAARTSACGPMEVLNLGLTYYFTDLDGEFDVPDGCILNCTGCVLVGGNNSSTMSGQNPVGTLEDTSASKGLSMNACIKLFFFVTQSAVNIGLSFFQ